MEDSNQAIAASAGHISSGTGDIKQTFWIAREAHRLASAAARNLQSDELVSVSFDVCVEVQYIKYHEEGYAAVKSSLNRNLVSTCTGNAVRLEHKIDPAVTFLDKDMMGFYRVVGQVLYRVK